MGTFDSIYQNKIRQLEEENRQLRKLIEANEPQTPSILNSIGYTNTGANEYGSTINQSSGIDLRGVPGNQTGGPLFAPGYLPPNLMNFIIRTLGAMGGDSYGLIQNGQINWANWALQTASNTEFSSYIAPLLQAINGQLGSSAMQQFDNAFSQWQASQSRR